MPGCILIVDDHASFRRLASALLRGSGWDEVAEAADGGEALRVVAALHPSVVLLDVGLPDQDGFAVAEKLLAQPDPPVVVLISARAATDYGDAVEHTSARGFIDKAEFSAGALEGLLGTAP